MLGPTASGKSEVALRLATRLGGVVLSVDSMQVYRGMDIGTAKPSPEERRMVPHLMLDLVDPEEDYSVAEFQAEARRLISTTTAPIVVAGGSGLHFRAIVDPLEFPPSDSEVRRLVDAAPVDRLIEELREADPAVESVLDLANPRRVRRAVEILRLTGESPTDRRQTDAAAMVANYEAALPFAAVGLDPGDLLADRARARLAEMRSRGLLDEVRCLAGRLGRTASQAVGYKQLLPVVRGEEDEDEGFGAAAAATLALARSQRTYFRRDPRIRWLEWEDDASALTDRAAAALGV